VIGEVPDEKRNDPPDARILIIPAGDVRELQITHPPHKRKIVFDGGCDDAVVAGDGN
jgi:hypothetical protein